jgi:hypothetical protein
MEASTMTRTAFVLCATIAAAGCSQDRPLVSPTNSEPPAPLAPPVRFVGPAPINGTPITAGETIASEVRLDDPNCFPDWDSASRCRQFDLVAPRDGELKATMTWTDASRGDYDPELFIATTGEDAMYALTKWPKRIAAKKVRAGVTYRIVVLSYMQAFTFQLSTEMVP